MTDRDRSLRLLLACAVAFAGCTSPAMKPEAKTISLGSSRSNQTELVGDALDPLQTFDRFLDLSAAGKLASEEGRAILADALAQVENTEPRPRSWCNKIIRLDDAHAVARTSETIPPREFPESALGEGMPPMRFPEWTVDFYWFLERTDRWRLTTMRALANTELLQMLAWGDLGGPDLGQEHVRMVANARLTLQSDRELTAWFHTHESQLHDLAARARALVPAGEQGMFPVTRDTDDLAALARAMNPPQERGDSSGAQVGSTATPVDPMRESIDALAITGVRVLRDGGVEVILGGMSDNEVLFLQSADGATPKIDPDEIIWAEPMGGGWFLVRTT